MWNNNFQFNLLYFEECWRRPFNLRDPRYFPIRFWGNVKRCSPGLRCFEHWGKKKHRKLKPIPPLKNQNTEALRLLLREEHIRKEHWGERFEVVWSSNQEIKRQEGYIRFLLQQKVSVVPEQGSLQPQGSSVFFSELWGWRSELVWSSEPGDVDKVVQLNDEGFIFDSWCNTKSVEFLREL